MHFAQYCLDSVYRSLSYPSLKKLWTFYKNKDLAELMIKNEVPYDIIIIFSTVSGRNRKGE